MRCRESDVTRSVIGTVNLGFFLEQLLVPGFIGSRESGDLGAPPVASGTAGRKGSEARFIAQQKLENPDLKSGYKLCEQPSGLLAHGPIGDGSSSGRVNTKLGSLCEHHTLTHPQRIFPDGSTRCPSGPTHPLPLPGCARRGKETYSGRLRHRCRCRERPHQHRQWESTRSCQCLQRRLRGHDWGV